MFSFFFLSFSLLQLLILPSTLSSSDDSFLRFSGGSDSSAVDRLDALFLLALGLNIELLVEGKLFG